MAVAMCHYFTARTPISQAMGNERVKGLGGGKKAAKGSSSWEAFLKKNPEREIK
jgi:crossover junction endodeoxyribonuclease RuvC